MGTKATCSIGPIIKPNPWHAARLARQPVRSSIVVAPNIKGYLKLYIKVPNIWKISELKFCQKLTFSNFLRSGESVNMSKLYFLIGDSK